MNKIVLQRGAATPDDFRRGNMCAMQAVGLLAGEQMVIRRPDIFGSRSEVVDWNPSCTSPALTEVIARANDHASFRDRQRLLPHLRKLIGLRPNEVEINAEIDRLVVSNRRHRQLRKDSSLKIQETIQLIDALRARAKKRQADPVMQPEVFDAAMKKFLSDVEHGRIKSNLKTAVLTVLSLGLLR